MALKDKLEARKRPEPGAAEGGLTVLDGIRVEPAPPPTPPAPAVPAKPAPPPITPMAAAKAVIRGMLVDRHADEIDITDRDGVRSRIESLIDDYAKSSGTSFNRLDYGHLVEAILDDVLGLGPLQGLLKDPAITEIMINHPQQVYVERAGRVTLSPIVFESAAQLRQVIDRIVSTVGRRVDESSPMCDARLRDGSRVNVVLPPLAIDGPCMTIRKFSRDKLRPADLLAVGTATDVMMQFLQAAVRTKLTVLISGGTSSGKTTLLNILSSFIPQDERIVTVEDSAELQLLQDHVIRLESRPPNIEGKGAIEIRELVRNALRMRPDRIVVGECRGGEALDMLQAMNTGHEGSMSTVHANTPYDAIGRLETMVLMAGADLPARAIQKQIASAIDVIVQVERVRGGARKIVSIAEITGLVNAETQFQELFQFRQTGVDAEGNAIGLHTATGRLGGILWLSALAAIGVLLACVAVGLPARASQVETPSWDAVATRGPATLRDRINQPFQAMADRSNRQRRLNGGLSLAEHLARADLKLRASEFVMIQLAFLVGGAAVAFWRFGFAPQFVIAGVGAYLLPMRFIKWRQGRRLKNFNRRLPDTLSLLSNALKAGLSLPQAIEAVAATSTPPISDELWRAIRELNLGTAMPQALANMVRRVGSEDLDLIVTAISIQASTGGNLSRILDGISHTIRQRIQIKTQISAMTAQMRASGWIITLLPFIVAGVLDIITPTYFRIMFTEESGRALLVIAMFSIFMGNVFVRRITNFRV
ncbi:MAG: hypothetical protein E6J53_05510 [Chloroflexi bacterium]|nr:MAG: hypothetical protein E6J53_05510 [Chloroflexota bacterium]